MRGRWLALAASLGLGLSLVGCGGGDDESSSEGTTAAGTTSGSIEVWIMQPGSEEIEKVVRDTAAAFEQQNPGATVDLQFVPWPQAHDQFVTAVGGGQVPDLAEMGTTWTPEFAALGALTPLEGNISEDFIPSLVESGTVDGTAFGRPWYAGARALIYRKDVLERLGLEPPGTWEELVAVGEEIDAETKLYPFGVIGEYTYQYLPMVWQAGGLIAEETEDGWVSRIDSPESVEAFSFYADLWERGWAPKGALTWNSADLRTAFGNGDFAMMVGGGWDVSAILAEKPELEGKLGTVLLPTGPGGSRDTFAGGSHLVVFQESDQQELAAKFADFMLQPNQVSEFAESLGFLPGTKSGIEASSAAGDELYQPFAEQLIDYSRTFPPTTAWGKFEGEALFVNAAQEIMADPAATEEILANLAQTMNEGFSE